MPVYDLGLRGSMNFASERVTVEADTIAEAIFLAEESTPGMRVHSGWAVEGQRAAQTDEDLERWMHAHHHRGWTPSQLGEGNGAT